MSAPLGGSRDPSADREEEGEAHFEAREARIDSFARPTVVFDGGGWAVAPLWLWGAHRDEELPDASAFCISTLWLRQAPCGAFPDEARSDMSSNRSPNRPLGSLAAPD